MSGDANEPWELAEFVDVLAAEVDKVEDTLSLKSHARRTTVALTGLKLDVAVDVRHTDDGRLVFRTTPGGQEAGTVLHLDLGKVVERQLRGARKDFEDLEDGAHLATLAGITEDEVSALNRLGIFSRGDLAAYTRTAPMLAEVSRRSGIAEARLRRWRRLPRLETIEPEEGRPGDLVRLRGGDLGAAPEPGDAVLFHGKRGSVESWSDTEIRAHAPDVEGHGLVVAIVAGVPTNALPWQVPTDRDGP